MTDEGFTVIGVVDDARPHGDGVIATLTIARVGSERSDLVTGVFTYADIAALLDALPPGRFGVPDLLSIEETIEALRKDR